MRGGQEGGHIYVKFDLREPRCSAGGGPSAGVNLFYTVVMSPSASGFILSIIISYMTYVRYWRYQRIKALEGRFNSVWEGGRLSPEQAQEILQTDLFYEHPLMFLLGTRVALFKVYALVCQCLHRLISSFIRRFSSPILPTFSLRLVS